LFIILLMRKLIKYLISFATLFFSCNDNSSEKVEKKLITDAMNYTVPNENKIKRLNQPSDNTCWATVATMMYMWKKQREIGIGEMLNGLPNPAFITYFNNNETINSKRKTEFLNSVFLKFEYPSSFLPSYLESKLRAYGPLWVTTKEGSNDDFSVHARICIGILGDGTVEGTFVKLIDPDGGKDTTENFDSFIREYEQASIINIQMVHW
jgi:hypothetical protein